MAGSWIKVEHGLPDKPEVRALARVLKVSPHEVVGLLVRFWIWCDANVTVSALPDCNAVVTQASAEDIDDIVRRPGFAHALQGVGWLRCSDATDPPSVVIPHFGRHNGKSAKTRALGQVRTQAHRAVTLQALPNGNELTVTRKEKSLKSSPKPPRSTPPKTPIPTPFDISDRVRAWAAERKVANLEEHVAHFIDKATANGYRYADWDAALMMAIRTDWLAGAAGAQQQKKADQPWWASDDGIQRKAVEVGIRARPGESFRDLASRIRSSGAH